MTQKIVINVCYGGFSISLDAAKFMAERGNKRAKAEIDKYEQEVKDFEEYKKSGKIPDHVKGPYIQLFEYGPRWHGYGYVDGFEGDYARDDKDLVDAVENLGPKANGGFADLKVVSIPDGIEYKIEEYDGTEWVAEKHRTWG